MSNVELLNRRNAAVPRGVASATVGFAVKGENTEVWDADGKRYLDFAASIAVCNTGHRHPKVMAAVFRQCEALVHTAFQVVPYETYIALAERLNQLAPINKFPQKLDSLDASTPPHTFQWFPR
jgi:4-aminobutyrate aminotransferase-like enzyme